MSRIKPHSAEGLENNQVEEAAVEVREIDDATQSKDDNEETGNILQFLQNIDKEFQTVLCPVHEFHDCLIPASSFNMGHLPEGFQHAEVVDCVQSLVKQTGLFVTVRGLTNIRGDHGGLRFIPFGSGRLWRMQRPFTRVDNATCPCNDCQRSTNPRKRWAEYIVLTRSWKHNVIKCSHFRFILGYNSDQNMSDVSVLKGVSVIHSDESRGFSEVLCITHETDTSKKVDDLCHESSDCRRKLQSRCHLLDKSTKLAVHVLHHRYGPKNISVGKWLKKEGDRAAGSSRHDYTGYAAGCYGSVGGPVLLVDGSDTSVTLHCQWDSEKDVGQSCGNIWSL